MLSILQPFSYCPRCLLGDLLNLTLVIVGGLNITGLLGSLLSILGLGCILNGASGLLNCLNVTGLLGRLLPGLLGGGRLLGCGNILETLGAGDRFFSVSKFF